jgi:hypothetical protein
MTAGFLALVAALFGALWLSDIAGSIASGSLPPSVAELAVPTSAVYALDLGFVLPLFLVGAIGLARRARHAAPLALGSLVFVVLMALSILPMFAFEAARGELVDPVALTIFLVIVLVATYLIGIGAIGRRVRVGAAMAPQEPETTDDRDPHGQPAMVGSRGTCSGRPVADPGVQVGISE